MIALSSLAHAGDTTVVVDWTHPVGTINRPLFSLQGFMQIHVEPDPMVRRTFDLTNPTGTHARLETYIHQMEPENDNDDPATFDWSRLHPDRMIRFIEDREAFEKVAHGELGMEPLSLLCYMVDWLKSGDPDRPIASVDEWAEFAAAVVESYNGRGEDYRLRLRLAQVWNEPNMTMFYTGTRESYFELFNAVADRLHRDYPGVMVGGPTITHSGHDPKAWMDGFLEECGTRADYVIFHHYGPMGEGHEVLINDVKRYAAAFRAIPGKQNGRVMITETDAWFQGWGKTQFILDRQFGFLSVSDLLLGVQHFCALYYNESGNYSFGVVDSAGGAVPAVFWPYWLFRNTIGEEVYTVRQGKGAAALNLVASRHRGAGLVANAVMHNHTEEPVRLRAMLHFEPTKEDRVLLRESVTDTFTGIAEATRVPAGIRMMTRDIDLAPGEAMALTLQAPGTRHYAFRDINNQETPWIGTRTETELLRFQETADLRVEVLNTTFDPISGELEVRGLPPGWTAEAIQGATTVANLELGQRHTAAFRITAAEVHAGEAVAPYVVLSRDGVELDRLAHSVPVRIENVSPVLEQVLPVVAYAVRGDEAVVEIQLTNNLPRTLEGTFAHEVAAACEEIEAPPTFSLQAGERARFAFRLNVRGGAPLGVSGGRITARFLGTEITAPYTVEVVDGAPARATTIDLGEHLNFDAISFAGNRADYDQQRMGMFAYPADFTPSGRVARARGVPYAMPSLEDGKLNAVLPRGQRIAVPDGPWSSIVFLGFGHDGKHPGEFTLHYADGSSDPIASQIPEWCSPTPDGFSIAFDAPHRHLPAGQAGPACQLFSGTLPVREGKRVVAVELPTFERGAYVLAMTAVE